MYSSVEYCVAELKTDMAEKPTQVQEPVQRINIILMLNLKICNFDKLCILIYLSFNFYFWKKHFEYNFTDC